MSKFSFKDIMSKLNKRPILSLLYWVMVFIPVVLINSFTIYSTVIILGLLAYLPYRIFLTINENPDKYKNKTTWDVVKSELKPTISAFFIFLGVVMIFNLAVMPPIVNLSNNIKNSNLKLGLEKVLDLENLEIYIDEEAGKYYSFYKMNGKSGTEFVDIDNLILFEDSELPKRYGEFHAIDNYEVAFATYKNQLFTEALFKITKNDKTYLIKSYIPQENSLNLLRKTNFKEVLNLVFKDGTIQNIYINQETSEIAISNNNIVVTSKYAETPYDKEDYFTYRYDVFNNTVSDITQVNDNISVSLLNTYSNISNDIKRVTFYLEGSDSYNYSEIIEIIFDTTSYVFRTGIIDISNLESINRAQ